jgi:hypothetical protein
MFENKPLQKPNNNQPSNFPYAVEKAKYRGASPLMRESRINKKYDARFERRLQPQNTDLLNVY